MRLLFQALLLFVLLTILTGVLYPFSLTAISGLLFPYQAGGSLLVDQNGVVRGSALLGQEFSSEKYFWSRPSATAPYPYNAAASSGSNLGPTNSKLIDQVKEKLNAFQQSNHAPSFNVSILPPQDLLTASASGLDPHISVEAANYQMERVASARQMDIAKLRALVQQYTQGRDFGILGEARVNVVRLNLALDNM